MSHNEWTLLSFSHVYNILTSKLQLATTDMS